MNAQPVMLGAPQERRRRRTRSGASSTTPRTSTASSSRSTTRRRCIRANFIEGRLDHQRIFNEINENVVEPFQDDNTTIYVAGEPRLYGWVYHYAGDVFWILVSPTASSGSCAGCTSTTGAARCGRRITGLIAAFWGLGFIYLIGLALDPLMLVMPFLITARAVSHAIQMHDRYYEEFEKSRLAQAAGDRRLVRRALRADALGHRHRRLRRARHPARAGRDAAEARDHRRRGGSSRSPSPSCC